MTQPLFYKDLFSGQHSYTEKELGRKGLSLAQLVAQNIPVPPFFILPPELFRSIIASVFKDTSITSLESFREHVNTLVLSKETMQQIEAEYAKLSGFGKAWVAVRSSIVAPEHPTSSFSGLLASKLNLRGTHEIELAIREIFLSLFADRSYDYLKRNSISYGDVSTAIIVQKMVQAEVSGIMYTYDPITNNGEHVSIEAVFGLGDVLTEGNINPDIYTVSKTTLEIIEKKIVPQEWMKVRKMGEKDTLEHLQKITISQMWQYSQKLDDSLVRELTALADKIEQATGTPQIIEWAMERGSLYVLQAKPMELDNTAAMPKIHDAARKISSLKDIDEFSELSNTTEISFSHEAPMVDSPKMPQETLLFTGTPASSGVAYGETILLPNASSMTPEMLTSLKETTTKKHILVTDEFTSELEPLFYLAGGVITNFGGANSDVGLVTRETKIPAIVGTRIATSYLQSGALIKMDGSSGAIYRVDFLPEEFPATTEKTVTLHKKKKLKKKINTAVSPILEPPAQVPILEALAGKQTIEKTPVQKKSVHDSPIKIFLTGSTVSEAVFLPSKHAAISSNATTFMIPVSNAAVSERAFIKKVKKESTATIYLLLSDSPSLDALLSAKRTLAAHSIRRSKRVPYIVNVGSMYGLLNSKNLIDLSIDGLLFDLPKLSRVYRPGTTSIDAELWKLLRETLRSVKKQKLSYIGLSLPKEFFTLPLRKEIRELLKEGITSLVFAEPVTSATEHDMQKIEEEIMGVQLEKV
ncbi:hypothetical protein COZ14_00530 [Candidatus Dojkabacteria bacterium CG_4_10_14_3_um_filter_Dojkabacteria_WS6_41_9]|nr:MAG: hypothetical protein COZ14_00530 [Candidatus Dojkabacteria bacterium CG_4_10_14_3_um_filter_Dojkabacteria_WS6_41_9]